MLYLQNCARGQKWKALKNIARGRGGEANISRSAPEYTILTGLLRDYDLVMAVD